MMKTINKVLILLVFFAAISCSSDDNDNDISPSGYYLTAKVDGENFSNSSAFEPALTYFGDIINIQSSDNSGNAIQIAIYGFNGVGTYTSGNNDLTRGYINYLDMGLGVNNFTTYTSVRGSGEVKITKVTDTEIEGTFSATAVKNIEGATEDISITKGEFRVEKLPQS